MVVTEKRIPLLDLAAQHRPIRDELIDALTGVVDSQHFIMGSEVKELENAIAQRTAVAHGIGCASGSDALYVALLSAGVGPGDTVLTTPFSFFATAGSISRTGATPAFVDIDPHTFNIDPELLADAVRKHSRVKAIIPVHLFGGCADMDPIMDIARQCGAVVIEDGAQSIGAEYKGRPAQSIGDMGCISFFPSKNLGALGDGGMILTDNPVLAEKASSLRLHGTTKKYYHRYIGTNSRLDTLQAAVLLVKLRYIDAWTEGRIRNAVAYRTLLNRRHLPIILPSEMAYQTRHVYNQFVIRCERRDELKAYLQQHGVGTEIYYPLSLHLQPCYADLGYEPGSMPESERASKDVLALPIHAGLEDDDLAYICDRIACFYAE